VEQWANIGGEVQRTINWTRENKEGLKINAFRRCLELIDLTAAGLTSFPRLKELLRARELLVDHFLYQNQYQTTQKQWERYFLPFAVAARKGSTQ
jgi:hypothetical protein